MNELANVDEQYIKNSPICFLVKVYIHRNPKPSKPGLILQGMVYQNATTKPTKNTSSFGLDFG